MEIFLSKKVDLFDSFLEYSEWVSGRMDGWMKGRKNRW